MNTSTDKAFPESFYVPPERNTLRASDQHADGVIVFASVAIVNFIVVVAMICFLLFLSGCSNGSGDSVLDGPAVDESDNNLSNESVSGDDESSNDEIDTDENVSPSAGTINTSNRSGIYNEAIGILNAAPFEKFVGIYRDIVINPWSTRLTDFQAIRVESDSQIWNCVDGNCEGMPDFASMEGSRVAIDYQCVSGGMVSVEFFNGSTTDEHDMQFESCGLRSTDVISGRVVYFHTPNYSTSPPSETHRFYQVEIFKVGGLTETLSGQINWRGGRHYYDFKSAELSLGSIPNVPFEYLGQSAEGDTFIESISAWRTVGRPFNEFNSPRQWENTLRTSFRYRSPVTNQQLVSVRTLQGEDLVTTSAEACFDTGVLSFEAVDTSKLVVSATGVEDQVAIELTDSQGSVVLNLVEPWITADRPEPPRQLDFAQAEASVTENDSCSPFKLDASTIAPLVYTD